MLEPVVGTQGAEERLLERVLRLLPADTAHEEPEDLALVALVEDLERRNGDSHRHMKRTRGRRCET